MDRDPYRFEHVADVLARCGARAEDQRVGQFIVNVLRLNGLDTDSLFNIECARLAAMLDSYPQPLKHEVPC